ncbi:hypothetical protein CCE29_12015 [Lacticaseibacillus rhamnosus]|nr:hypothetical protein B4583_07920 [Lacticaseibacillus rhamnosus]AXI94885.1 hypothetical protein DU507_10495 [Lacticaseibacillus rhamnosus GG]ART96618.1 hypothetical protein CCE29_12015 [Lacticaseibacillus rhamnosus]AZZ23556.1 hypothetical protein CYG41_10455 [Lacticaseibacillus rhamnosus]PTV04003.1 hypothetical protein DB338_13800 [Lacticaseibacillus rhamnosus]
MNGDLPAVIGNLWSKSNSNPNRFKTLPSVVRQRTHLRKDRLLPIFKIEVTPCHHLYAFAR